MEAQTTVSNSTQCGLFTGEYKEYTVSGVTFSFKVVFHWDQPFQPKPDLVKTVKVPE